MKVKVGIKSEIIPYTRPWLAAQKPWIGTYEEAKLLVRDKLENATVSNMISDVEVGCFLSGGIDSSAVIALMQSKTNKPIKAFTIGFNHYHDVEDESSIAKNFAERIGAEFNLIEITDDAIPQLFNEFVHAIDQPSIDGFNTFLVSKYASKYVKVALTGIGGDELFGGYPHFKSLIHAKTSKIIYPWNQIARMLHKIRPNKYTSRLNLKGRNPVEALQQIRMIYSEREIAYMLKSPSAITYSDYSISGLSTLQNISIAELSGYLRNTLLRDCDAVSMWHGLELRPVLLDQNLVEFALQLPDDYKVRNGQLKALFKDSIRDLLSHEVLNQSKKGFELPFSYWMNGVLNETIYNLLNTNSPKELFSDTFIDSFKRRTEKKKLTRRDWLLVVLLGWIHSEDNYA